MIIVINKRLMIVVALLLIFVVLLLLFIRKNNNFQNTSEEILQNTMYQPPEKSREELYQDIFISLLLPYIQNEVDKYYAKYLTQTPLVYPYDVYVLSAERPNGYRTFLFRVKLQFYSYVGPHINVGLETITATVGGSGDVKIEEFEHIKSYVLPPNYEHIIRKGYKNPIP